MTAPFHSHQDAARAILLPALQGSKALRAKEGQFLGGLAFDANPPTGKASQLAGHPA